jgi:hypothetical protein
MEGFDRIVDKHYDKFHDGVGKQYHGFRKRVPGRGRKQVDGKPAPDQPRSSSEPRDDRYRRPQNDSRPQDFSEDDDQGYVSEYPRRRPREDPYSRENEPSGGVAYAPDRKVRINPIKEVWVPTVKPALLSLWFWLAV